MNLHVVVVDAILEIRDNELSVFAEVRAFARGRCIEVRINVHSLSVERVATQTIILE